MKRNVGNVDRIVRIVLAAILVELYFGNIVEGTAGIIFLVLAGVFTLTALVGFCPLYAPFGISTCKVKA